MGADEIEGGGTADFIEGLAEKLFAIEGIFLEESEVHALRCGPLRFWAGRPWRSGGFFGGVVEKREEPGADGFFEVGLLSFGEAGSDGADDGHALEADIG